MKHLISTTEVLFESNCRVVNQQWSPHQEGFCDRCRYRSFQLCRFRHWNWLLSDTMGTGLFQCRAHCLRRQPSRSLWDIFKHNRQHTHTQTQRAVLGVHRLLSLCLIRFSLSLSHRRSSNKIQDLEMGWVRVNVSMFLLRILSGSQPWGRGPLQGVTR